MNRRFLPLASVVTFPAAFGCTPAGQDASFLLFVLALGLVCLSGLMLGSAWFLARASRREEPPAALPEAIDSPRVHERSVAQTGSHGGKFTRDARTLDFASIIKATRAISGEIKMDQLLARLIRNVTSNAGAERACLFMEEDGMLRLMAEDRTSRDRPIVMQGTELSEAGVAASVVQYVKRTGEDVVLEDAAGAGRFLHDEYIQRLASKSLLCQGIVYQGRLTGLLYLENNLTTNAFTPDRLEVLGILASQAAVSLENARLIVEERERARLQQSLDSMVELDRVKTDFFTNVSHELRTPLTLILGPLRTIESEAGARLEAGERRLLRGVLKNAHVLQELVNNLLDSARLASGTWKPNIEVLDLIAFSREMIERFRPAVAAAGLELACESAPGPLRIASSRAFLERIYMNLLGNSLKFTVRGRIALRIEADESGVSLFFRDTGPGIPESERSRLFQRFATIHREETGHGQGTGLGLSLVRDLTVNLGGSIEYISPPEGGAEFRVWLPFDVDGFASRGEPEATTSDATLEAHRARLRLLSAGAPGTYENETAANETASAEERETGNGREHEHAGESAGEYSILIVEDNADLREYLITVLAPYYRAWSASDGREALAMLPGLRPDLILSDLMMPHVDGLELLERVRADAEFSATPFLLLTAKQEVGSRIAGLARGADDYIGKPFEPRELIARIGAALGRLERHHRALAGLQEKFIADLHDHLGAALTDLAFGVRRAKQSGADVSPIEENLTRVVASFKACLAGDGVFDGRAANFIDVIHSILLQRYADSGRMLQYESSDAARTLTSEVLRSVPWEELYGICQEVTTNDLKYGTGTSRWHWSARGGELRLCFRGRVASVSEGGRGTDTIRQRFERLGGRFRTRAPRGAYFLRARIPIVRET